MGFLTKFSPQIYALLRIVAGFLFLCHGGQKLFGWFGGEAQTGVPLMLVAGIIEFGGGLLIAIGFQTRIAAFLSSGLMASAYFMAHAKEGLLPIVNHGELAVIYCFLFLYLAARGSGVWSVDQAMGKG